MNFYNPYMNYIPYTTAKTGLFSRLFSGGINFSSILNGTSKVLNVANQAIPIVKQASPLFKNAKTMLRVMSEFKKVDTPKSINNITAEPSSNNPVILNESAPTFFV